MKKTVLNVLGIALIGGVTAAATVILVEDCEAAPAPVGVTTELGRCREQTPARAARPADEKRRFGVVAARISACTAGPIGPSLEAIFPGGTPRVDGNRNIPLSWKE